VSNNNNSSRLFAIRFLYTLVEKGQTVLNLKLLTPESLEPLFLDFLTSYREPDLENPYSEISDEQVFRAKKMIQAVEYSLEELHEILGKQVKQGLGSLKKMDYCTLLVGTVEILKLSIPFQVVCNEMVQISKEFSAENSPQFINGVLDGIGKNVNV